MSKNLTINTSKPQKWSPSPGLDIREEDEAPQKGFVEEDDDDEEEEEEEEEGSDFSSSPSIPDENINFDLVYTLHTFEATVDGQASVKKGDALTLLDDSNSYWWLIKDLKTSEVGYIPAENIETPFERLARLNKHRNVEITSLNHAAHYINNKKRTPSKKKVIMSPSVHVQLEIILTGEEGENKTEETTYETWDEDMIDHDDQDDGNQVKSDHEDENAEEEEQEAAKDDSLPHTPTEDNLSSKVLRVHAGNISVGASYHSIRVTENISTAELLSKAMEKFHIPQIDHHHKRTVSSVEYYLSVRNRDGEEITIGPEDKPYSIYETLNAHLTTPMPRLSEQLKLSGTLKKKKKMHDVQFLLHKRIKRTNDGGLVHIKLSLLAQKSTSEKGNPFQSWLMKKKKKVALEAERIDKMVAVHDAITISELTLIAFEKFHIVPHKSQKYRLLLHTKSRDVLLNNNLILSDVLRELSNNEEKQFVLHNFSSTQTTPHNNNKVCPETKQPIQVTMAVDRATQTILKRVDIALSEHSHQTPTEDGKFTMSVSRNDQNGVDIHLPHGLLRSSCLGQNRTQYSLLTSPTSNKPILQKVLPAIKGQQDESNGIISAEEMEALVRYASHYLDNLENKYSHRLSITNGREIDFSNMSDLEKELQKIIMLHSA